MAFLQASIGLVTFFALAAALGERGGQRRVRLAITAILAQLLIAAVMLRFDAAQSLFDVLNAGVGALQSATEAGTRMVFGFLGGGALPFDATAPGAAYVLAFRGLPLLVVVSALAALLTYWRILPFVIGLFARALQRTMGLSGAAGFGVTANVVMGMVEAPLCVAGYLRDMSRSDLFVLMSTGMATIAGTVWVLYATILEPTLPGAAGHLLVASLISAPAAIGIARLMVPQSPDTESEAERVQLPRAYTSAMDAIASGTTSGVTLLINVIAMLLVLVALVHLANLALELLPDVNGSALTFERIIGVLMYPVAWLMGLSADEAWVGARLLGVKTVLNELLAYLALAETPAAMLGERARLIMSYALCGFANPGSLGILIAGLCSIVPERRAEIVALGPRSLVAGTLATCSTGAAVALVAP